MEESCGGIFKLENNDKNQRTKLIRKTKLESNEETKEESYGETKLESKRVTKLEINEVNNKESYGVTDELIRSGTVNQADFQTVPAKLLTPRTWKTRFHPLFLMFFSAFRKIFLAGILLGSDILWKGE